MGAWSGVAAEVRKLRTALTSARDSAPSPPISSHASGTLVLPLTQAMTSERPKLTEADGEVEKVAAPPDPHPLPSLQRRAAGGGGEDAPKSESADRFRAAFLAAFNTSPGVREGGGLSPALSNRDSPPQREPPVAALGRTLSGGGARGQASVSVAPRGGLSRSRSDSSGATLVLERARSGKTQLLRSIISPRARKGAPPPPHRPPLGLFAVNARREERGERGEKGGRLLSGSAGRNSKPTNEGMGNSETFSLGPLPR